MSTSSNMAKPAPWKPLFLTHISKMESPEFVFSTLQQCDANSTSYLPRARYCVFRGMWAEMPENKHNEAPMNERVFESDLLTLTTDVRMRKIPQIVASGPEQGSNSQSGGGGPVEAVFWVKSTMTQWRIKGDAYFVGPDIEDSENVGVANVKKEIGKRMRVVKEESKKDWSWTKELTAHFGNLSPGMRGSFKNPPPGTPVSQNPGNLKLGQKVTDLKDEIARKNFRVIIIKPNEVEQVDLTDPDEARRWVWKYVGNEAGGDLGDWTKEELWP